MRMAGEAAGSQAAAQWWVRARHAKRSQSGCAGQAHLLRRRQLRLQALDLALILRQAALHRQAGHQALCRKGEQAPPQRTIGASRPCQARPPACSRQRQAAPPAPAPAPCPCQQPRARASAAAVRRMYVAFSLYSWANSWACCAASAARSSAASSAAVMAWPRHVL